MPDRLLFGKTFRALENAIGIAQQRHTLIISNVSNLDTPGYRAKDIDFKTAMAQALGSGSGMNLVKTNPKHIGLGKNSAHRVEPFEEKGEWNGFNWVEIDKEMTKLAKNNLMHRTAVEALSRKLATLKEFIREGGR